MMRAPALVHPSRRRLATLGADTSGVAAIEFALVIPIFMLVIYSFMELGRALFIHNSLGNAVFEAARYAIVHGSASDDPASTGDITDELEASASQLDPDLLDVDVSFTPNNDPGSVVSIAATYQFHFMTGLIPVSSFDMVSETTAVIAR
jgi:Flp pilus assembly protein TadG